MPPKYDIELYKLQAELCKTFSDPKRLIIISDLRYGEKSVGELSSLLGCPQALTSRHLAILRKSSVVQARREGVSIYYSLTNPRIVEACDISRQVLLEQIARHKKIAEKLNV
jgi:ArsR family transcriptional regulator, virulence genes transcriptional regulator